MPGNAMVLAGGTRTFDIHVADRRERQPVDSRDGVEMVFADPASADETYAK